MIAKGNLHAHGGRLAVYMTSGKDGERAELIEMRGFLSKDLREGFRTIQTIAESQTQCAKPFFHAYVRLPEGEDLNPRAWLAVADRIETALGFNGQPRAVAFHIGEDGERHMHTAWSRIDTGEMRAIDPGLYKNKLKEICRTLEAEYGLQPVKNEREPEQQTKGPARGEFEEARRLGVDVEAIRETIRVCYDQSDNGRSFAAALAEHGLGLARGDRRDFVVIDGEGGQHALGHRICGAGANDIRQRLGEGFKQSLPSVDELRSAREDRAAITDHQRGRNGMDEELTDDGLKRQAQREAEQLAAAKEIKETLTRYEAQKQQDAETARQEAQKRRQADERRSAEGEPNSAESRYAQALGQHYDMRDPYGSLSRAAMAEYGQFHRQREGLRKEAAAEKDPAKRTEIELRMKIEACDYMAITSDRLAGISVAVAGREDSPQAKADRERAAFWKQEASKAREQRAQQMEAQQQQRRQPEQGRERSGIVERFQPKREAAPQRPAADQSREGLRPYETVETRAATPEARRSEREAEEFKAAGVDRTQTAQQPGRPQRARGGGRGR